MHPQPQRSVQRQVHPLHPPAGLVPPLPLESPFGVRYREANPSHPPALSGFLSGVRRGKMLCAPKALRGCGGHLRLCSGGTGRGATPPPPAQAFGQSHARVWRGAGGWCDLEAPRRKGVTQLGWSRKMEAQSRLAAQPQLWLTGANWGDPGGDQHLNGERAAELGALRVSPNPVAGKGTGKNLFQGSSPELQAMGREKRGEGGNSPYIQLECKDPHLKNPPLP